MTSEKLREAHRARPFLPFVIRLADGDSVPVRHPETLAVSPSGRTVIVYHDDDIHSAIDLLLVTRLEVSSPSQATSSGQN